MVTLKYNKTCDLCGQTVEIEGFFLVLKHGRKDFCCAGCQSLYQLLYANKIAPPIINNIQKNEDS